MRFTYTARVHVPKALRAIMSAPNDAAHRAGRRIRVRDGQAHPVVPARDRGRRYRGAVDRPAQRRLRRAFDRRRGREGIRRHRGDDRGDREALRPVSLGPLRHARAAAELSVRRHGESVHDVRDADGDRRRQEPGLAGRARAGAFVVGQSRHERGVEAHVAQRRLHDLCREPHRRSRVRQGRGRRGVHPRRRRAARRARRDAEAGSAAACRTSTAAIPTMRDPISRTRRAPGCCARSKRATAATCSILTCAAISITSRSRASRPTRCSRIWTRI